MEKEINSGAVSHLYRAAEEFAGVDDYIRRQTKEYYDKVVSCGENKAKLDLVQFRSLDDVFKPDLMLMCLEKLTPHRKDITFNHIEALLNLAKGSDGGAVLDLPYGLIAERSYDFLTIFRKDTKSSLKNYEQYNIPQLMDIGEKIDISIPNLGMAHIEILQYNGGKLFPTSSYTKWFDYDRIQGAIFRRRSPEDFIYVEQDKGLCKKKISKLMTDEKIPRAQRDEMFLLANGSEVIWLPGYRMSGAYKISETTDKILAINIDNGGII